MIYLLISIILDITASTLITSTYQNVNYLFPQILVSSLTISYLLIKNKKLYFIIITLLGLIYDILYSDIFLINTYFFLLQGLFLQALYKNKEQTPLNVSLISILTFIFYDIYIFFTLILLKEETFKITELYYKISHSLILNIIYITLSLVILKSRIFTYKNKIKKKKKIILFHRW